MSKVHLVCIFALSLGALLFGDDAAEAAVIRAPVARIHPVVDTVHGDVRTDNYYWLRRRDDPEVMEYLRAENDYTRAMMSETESLQDSLYAEMLARIKETDLSVPARLDDYYYYSRTEKGKEYPIYCRKRWSLDSTEQVLLDMNMLASEYSYLELGVYEVSPDHSYLAYSIDTSGAERYTLYFKDLDENAVSRETVNNVGYQAAWANDNRTIYYTVLDEAKRPYKLYQHILGADSSEDSMVYHEKDEAFWIDIERTRSEQYVLMNTSSHRTTEIHYADADSPQSGFSIFRPRETGIEYYIDHRADKFYIMTNDDAANFKLMEAPIASRAAQNWQEIIPNRDSITITGFDAFEKYLVVYERREGLRNIHVIDMVKNTEYYIDFPEPVYTFWLGDNPEFRTDLLRFEYMSLITPGTIFDYNMATRVRELKKQYEVLGGYDPEQYCSERILVRSEDGTLIPISMVYRTGVQKNGNNPLLLTGYGAYGFNFEPYFSRNRLSLLDRGFIFAIAHVRGGGEMGKSWHTKGQFLNKKNTFADFISCAQHLLEEKYTSHDRLVISGGSSGGLLMGAVVNMRPELFKAVIADVPFVDVINTMLDPSIPLTVVEYTELGSPFEEEFYWYMKSYSPYDNVSARDYPNMLVVAGFNDPRVQYWEAAKWVAKLRALKTDGNLLLLKINMDAGHEGASGRYGYLKSVAFEYAFILKVLGMD
ncbi:MAG: S9 family peptidase [candidate division WOR-3 bacterium]|nr:MAG: S9 family peptidase [candidate division WOR-3 bacterium]